DRAGLRGAVALVAGHQRQSEKSLRFQVVRVESYNFAQRFLIRLARAKKTVVLNGRSFALVTRLDRVNIKPLSLIRFDGQFLRAFDGLVAPLLVHRSHGYPPLSHRALGI